MARARSKTQKTAPTKLAAQTDSQGIITRHRVQDQMSIGEKSPLRSLTLSVVAHQEASVKRRETTYPDQWTKSQRPLKRWRDERQQ
jgi:hypothetical protein